MDSAITLVLGLLDEWLKHLEINAGTGGGVVRVGITYLEEFYNRWKGQQNKVAACIDGMDVFKKRRWLRLWMECVDFEVNHIPVGQFQLFKDIVCYLQILTGDTVSTA